jgi:hypothetical protein
MQIELNEEELVQLILLVTADIVAETRRLPPDTDFKPALSDLAMANEFFCPRCGGRLPCPRCLNALAEGVLAESKRRMQRPAGRGKPIRKRHRYTRQ